MHVLYERVVNQLLTESKVDTFARTITRKIIRGAKVFMNKINTQQRATLSVRLTWPKFLKRRVPSDQSDDLIYVNLTFDLTQSKQDEIIASGAWVPFENMLEIKFKIKSTTGFFAEDHLSQLQVKAYDVVRHELEHATQTLQKIIGATDAAKSLSRVLITGGIAGIRSLLQYYTSQAEIEAFVAGLYHRAKRVRQPFILVVDEVIEKVIEDAAKLGLDLTEVRYVMMEARYRWLQYAKKRFPKAVVQY